MEVKNKKAINEEVVEKEDVIETLEEKRDKFNKKESERIASFKHLRPKSVVRYMTINYDDELVELEVTMPDNKVRFEIMAMDVSENPKLSMGKVLEKLNENNLIRVGKNGSFDSNDYPFGEMLNFSAIMFQYINK